MQEHLEYVAVRTLAWTIGKLPRRWAWALCGALARLAMALVPKLRRTALRNLELAFPAMAPAERERIPRELCASVGRMAAEFCRFASYTKENVAEICVHEGLENYQAAVKQGRGVLVLTGHIGGWEVGSFAHSVYGMPMHIVVRDIDNKLVDGLARRTREMHGNVTVDARKYARNFVRILREGGTLGVLMDTNVTPPRGVFAPFFGRQAATGSAVAKLAWHTGAAVVPGYTVWDAALGKYVIHFHPALQLQKSTDEDADILANTAQFNRVYEEIIRKYPEQWLWVHRRWKTRPEGEQPLY